MMTKHVATLITSQTLKEAGFPQTSKFCWSKETTISGILAGQPLVDREEWVIIDDPFPRDGFIAAPQLTELLKELPPIKVGGKGATYFFTLMRAGADGSWVAGYYSPIKVSDFYDWLVKVTNVSAIEAVARVYLKLKGEDE